MSARLRGPAPAAPWQASFSARDTRGERSLVGDTGLEHPARTHEKPRFSGQAAQKAAQSEPVLSPDALDLARRLAALPETVRAEVVAMVKAVAPGA